jgi:branched-chain amino acid transport system substrate-binding protein
MQITMRSLFRTTAVLLCLAGTANAADDKIIIGGALCLTGAMAAEDAPAAKGAEVAVKYLNDNGGLLGKQVEFINIDGKTDPVTVGNAAVELIDKGAKMIMTPCDFDFGSPAAREAQAAGLVGISTCAGDPLYSSWTLGDKQFTAGMWTTTMGAVPADFAFKEKGWKTAYVVTDQFMAYTKSLSKYFVEQFKADGGEIILEDTYTNGDNNFSAQLARLKALSRKPDVIFLSSYGPDIGAIIRALREVGYDTPILGGDAYDDTALYESLGEKFGNNVFFDTHTFLAPEVHPDMQKFIDLYTELHGGPPDVSFAASGWDAVMIMAQAVTTAGTTDGAAVAKALEEGKFSVLTGNVLQYGTAQQGHMPSKSAAMIEIKDGKPVFLGWRRPESLPAP